MREVNLEVNLFNSQEEFDKYMASDKMKPDQINLIVGGNYLSDEDIQKIVDALEVKGIGGVTPEQIAAAVEAYMAAHPIAENDPTVPAWAKAAQKPTYTADEVGAYAKPSGGIPESDLSEDVKEKLNPVGGGGQLTKPFVLALQSILRDAHFTTDRSTDITNLIKYAESGGEEPEPQITLTSISAVYNGAGEDAETDVYAIDITVTAHWSDGSTTTIASGYTIDGVIAAGIDNILTIEYEGKSTTISVPGNESGIETQTPLYRFETFSKSGLNSTATISANSEDNSFSLDTGGYSAAYVTLSQLATTNPGNLNGGSGLKGGELWFTIPNGAKVEMWLADAEYSTYEESRNYGFIGLFDNDNTSSWSGAPVSGLGFTLNGKTSIASALAGDHISYTAAKDINVRCFGCTFNNLQFFNRIATKVRMTVNGVRWL